jgi:hypothetical protein
LAPEAPYLHQQIPGRCFVFSRVPNFRYGFVDFVDPSTKARQAFLLDPMASFELSEAGNLDADRHDMSLEAVGHPMGTPWGTENPFVFVQGLPQIVELGEVTASEQGTACPTGKAKQSNNNYMLLFNSLLFQTIPNDSSQRRTLRLAFLKQIESAPGLQTFFTFLFGSCTCQIFWLPPG